MPARAHCPRETIAAGPPAFVYLKCVGKQRFGLAASGRGSIRIDMRVMCPAVSGEKFSPTENAGYIRQVLKQQPKTGSNCKLSKYGCFGPDYKNRMKKMFS
jgi:hypothetical protein